jgi:hypothetical protein
MNNEPIGGQPPDFPAPEYQEAPAPEVKKKGALERIVGMFFEPSETYQSIKARPTWLVAFLVTMLFGILFYFAYTSRVPYEVRFQAQMDRTMQAMERFSTDERQVRAMREEFERRAREGETMRGRVLAAASQIGLALILLVVVAALYLVGSILVGKRMTFKQALAVRAYADLPPSVVWSIITVILMFVKSPDEIDPVDPRSILTSNLGPLIDKEQVVLKTLANNIDLFQIWGIILAIIGMTIVPEKITRGQAIGIVVFVWLLGLLVKIGFNSFTGGAL